jgi:hypothetical protein
MRSGGLAALQPKRAAMQSPSGTQSPSGIGRVFQKTPFPSAAPDAEYQNRESNDDDPTRMPDMEGNESDTYMA